MNDAATVREKDQFPIHFVIESWGVRRSGGKADAPQFISTMLMDARVKFKNFDYFFDARVMGPDR